jgi:hypothetical protein
MQSLTEALQCQMGLNKQKNHLHPDAVQRLEIHPVFHAALANEVMNPVPSLTVERVSSLSSIATDLLVKGVYSLNQYLQVSADARDSLKLLYQVTFRDLLRTKDIESTLRGFHFPRLVNWIASIHPESLRNALRPYTEIGSVVCQEYSPELQLRLMRISLDAVRQPVLDIGCGRSALLVKYLRARHIDAFGRDRVLTQEASYLETGDWLTDGFGHLRWGTVISNMAFSNHFIYAQHYDEALRSKYAGRYRAILDSLQKGGSFTYGPSAPELEGELHGREYRIEKWSTGYGHSITRVSRIAP